MYLTKIQQLNSADRVVQGGEPLFATLNYRQ